MRLHEIQRGLLTQNGSYRCLFCLFILRQISSGEIFASFRGPFVPGNGFGCSPRAKGLRFVSKGCPRQQGAVPRLIECQARNRFAAARGVMLGIHSMISARIKNHPPPRASSHLSNHEKQGLKGAGPFYPSTLRHLVISAAESAVRFSARLPNLQITKAHGLVRAERIAAAKSVHKLFSRVAPMPSCIKGPHRLAPHPTPAL